MHPQDNTQLPLPLDSEDWRPVVGFEGWYAVSDLGNIRRVMGGKGSRVGKVLRPTCGHQGYPQVGLYRDGKHKGCLVHRLVAEAFLGPCPPGYEVNHINGIKGDARAGNLAWVTSSENTRHADGAGLVSRLRGEAAPGSKLSRADVETIRNKRGIVTALTLAERFGVSRSHIYHIQAGHYWKDADA